MKSNKKGLKGFLLLLSGILTCPCHLPATLALLTWLLAGTSAAALIADNYNRIVFLFSLYFFGLIAYAVRRMTYKP